MPRLYPGHFQRPIVTRSVGLTPQNRRDVQLVIHRSWSRRSWTAVLVETLRRGTATVLRHRLAHVRRIRALRLALGKRRHGRHGRTRGTGGDRRFAVLVAAAEADIGETLQQRGPGLVRMLL